MNEIIYVVSFNGIADRAFRTLANAVWFIKTEFPRIVGGEDRLGSIRQDMDMDGYTELISHPGENDISIHKIVLS